MKMPSDLTFFITLLSLVGNGIAARQFRSVFFNKPAKEAPSKSDCSDFFFV